MRVYIYIYMCMCMYVYVYMYPCVNVCIICDLNPYMLSGSKLVSACGPQCWPSFDMACSLPQPVSRCTAFKYLLKTFILLVGPKDMDPI